MCIITWCEHEYKQGIVNIRNISILSNHYGNLSLRYNLLILFFLSTSISFHYSLLTIFFLLCPLKIWCEYREGLNIVKSLWSLVFDVHIIDIVLLIYNAFHFIILFSPYFFDYGTWRFELEFPNSFFSRTLNFFWVHTP